MKVCRICKEEKTEDLLVKRGIKKDGLPSYRNICKSCKHKETTRARKVNKTEARRLANLRRSRRFSELNRTKRKLDNIRHLYGVSPEDYLRIFDLQGGRCIICENEKPLAVDHCHETGRFRGLLCRQCNSGIGMFQDNIKSLENAIKYLSLQHE